MLPAEANQQKRGWPFEQAPLCFSGSGTRAKRDGVMTPLLFTSYLR
jgi:hypothetical protein